jgi:hypothetical protein
MEISVDQKMVFELLDVLLERWRANPRRFPFDKPEAVLPQAVDIPEEVRRDKAALARFYFYACIYMRGGIESGQAFRALVQMWRAHRDLFDPLHAQWMGIPDVQEILKGFVGWDSLSAATSWVENSGRLMRHWDGDPLNLIKGLRDYDEALRRIRNKSGKGEKAEAGLDGLGFRGFQAKMVSMILYFFDWEGWLRPRFLYPSPADFHNFRLGLNQGAIIVPPGTRYVRQSEALSKPWRTAVLEYLRIRGADPVEVSDVLWLFSLVMCGYSPLTTTREPSYTGAGLFRKHGGLEHDETRLRYLSPRYRQQLQATCLSCPFNETCTLAIPARPYYRKGILVLNERFRVEEYLGSFETAAALPSRRQAEADRRAHHTFDFDPAD